MENTLNETDAHQSFHSPPKRRRSTFFERRESFVPQPQLDTINQIISKKESESKLDKHNEEMKKYHSKLLCEKEQWKKKVKDRRNRYHDLKQQLVLASKSSTRSRVSYSSLTNEDIEFLKAKPNITKLIESQLKLHRSVNDTRGFYNRINELDNVILNYNENRIEKVTQHILENSTVDLIDNTNV